MTKENALALMNQIYREVVGEPDIYVCQFCDMRFRGKTERLKNHVIKHIVEAYREDDCEWENHVLVEVKQ
jgi:hypothetical protein